MEYNSFQNILIIFQNYLLFYFLSSSLVNNNNNNNNNLSRLSPFHTLHNFTPIQI